MSEFVNIIEEYSDEGYHMYSKRISRSEWGNKQIAESYLNNYWLPNAEYELKWRPIQHQIFVNLDSGLPKRVYAPGFEFLIGLGGCLFIKEEFDQLRVCLLETGAKWLFIVENTFGCGLKEPAFRMKYPANITWEQLNSGNFASSVMIEMIHKEYCVFGDIPCWGRYSANEYELPLHIVGYKPEFRSLFQEKFKMYEADRPQIAEHIPAEYMIDDKTTKAD